MTEQEFKELEKQLFEAVKNSGHEVYMFGPYCKSIDHRCQVCEYPVGCAKASAILHVIALHAQDKISIDEFKFCVSVVLKTEGIPDKVILYGMNQIIKL